MGSFSLAHHPECSAYDGHCVRLRGRRLCIGCFIGYPVFAASLVVLFALSYWGIKSFLGLVFASSYAFIFGAALQLTLVLGKIVHIRRVSMKVALKTVQAIGLAFMFFPVLVLAVPLLLKVYLVLVLWSGFSAVTGATKMFEMGKTCGSCKYKGQWSQCPGFKSTIDKLFKAGFVTN
jgi:hypothetical protein